MAVFDLGKNSKDSEWFDIESGEILRAEFQTGYAIIAGEFHGDASYFLRQLEPDISLLPSLDLPLEDRRRAIVLLERTALELRELIGEL